MVRAVWILIPVVLVSAIAITRKADGRLEISALRTSATPSPRPKEIGRVYPSENDSQVSPTSQIGADLILNPAMRKDGSFDISTVVLKLDGQDITEKATDRGTMDYPQGRATLMYTPEEPLSEGKHEASLTLPSEHGRTTYHWSFTIAQAP
jgi:hypothetical protein